MEERVETLARINAKLLDLVDDRLQFRVNFLDLRDTPRSGRKKYFKILDSIREFYLSGLSQRLRLNNESTNVLLFYLQ